MLTGVNGENGDPVGKGNAENLASGSEPENAKVMETKGWTKKNVKARTRTKLIALTTVHRVRYSIPYSFSVETLEYEFEKARYVQLCISF